MTNKVSTFLLCIVCGIYAAPAPEPQSGGIPPLLTFQDGNVGVNFLGFKASAGLGGLLNGDATQGGLHAEAETPFGQKAGAGLGGQVSNGRSLGGLYAGATAGGGVGAAAGLGGVVGEEGSVGGSFATSSAGGASKTVIKGTGGVSGRVTVEKVVEAPTSHVEIEVEEKPLLPPKQTYVERTVIPNYVEKTIQVPSYVEKTVRVPTVIEKRIKVPAPSTIIEKEIEVPQPPATVTKVVQKKVVHPQTVIVKTKTKLRKHPGYNYAKYVTYHDVPYYGGVVAQDSYVDSVPHAGYSFAYGSHFNTADFLRNLFSIPLATYGAASRSVSGVSGGLSAGIAGSIHGGVAGSASLAGSKSASVAF